jgi:hypothetical protein
VRSAAYLPNRSSGQKDVHRDEDVSSTVRSLKGGIFEKSPDSRFAIQWGFFFESLPLNKILLSWDGRPQIKLKRVVFRAIRADDSENLILFHPESHCVHGLDAAKCL